MLIIGGPRVKFFPQEIEAITNYIEEGGSIFIALGEGGEEKYNFC